VCRHPRIAAGETSQWESRGMLALEITSQFKRDYRREKAGRHADLDTVLKPVIDLLIKETPLAAAKRDHGLKGDWKGCRDCHLKPDLVLIYRKTRTTIQLIRLGSHSELFG